MNAYFKEHIKRLLMKDIYLLSVETIILVTFIFLYSTNSPWTERFGFLGVGVIVFLFSSRIIQKTMRRTPEYRAIESLLLPLNKKEFLLQEFIKVTSISYPIVGCVFMVLMSEEGGAAPMSNRFLILSGMVLLILFVLVFVTSLLLAIHSKNIKFIHAVSTMARMVLFFVLFFGVNLISLICVNRLGFHNSPFSLVIGSSLFFIGLVIFYYFKMETFFLDEHKNYANKKIQWFDVPGLLVMGLLLFVMIFGIGSPHSRRPASLLPMNARFVK
jgi:hypothetical protein